MADRCFLYLGTRLAPSPVLVQQLCPGGELSAYRPAPGETCAALEVEWPDLRLRVDRWDRSSPGFPGQLQDVPDQVWQLAGGTMDARVHELLERIERTRHVLRITAEPGFDLSGRGWSLVKGVAAAHAALISYQSSLLDPQLRYLLAFTGGRDDAAEIPALASALARKARSEARLQAMGVPFAPHLPPVPGDEEAVLRHPVEAARRALALLTAALHSEGMEDAAAILRDAGHWDAASPREQAFLTNPRPGDQDVIDLRWRYEALWVLLWALGAVELGPPTSICDVPAAVQAVRKRGPQRLVGRASLRPLAEILEELDFTYRCHWAVVDARIRGADPPGGLEPGVVYERHYTLNWLTVFRDQDWDNVTTDT